MSWFSGTATPPPEKSSSNPTISTFTAGDSVSVTRGPYSNRNGNVVEINTSKQIKLRLTNPRGAVTNWIDESNCTPIVIKGVPTPKTSKRYEELIEGTEFRNLNDNPITVGHKPAGSLKTPYWYNPHDLDSNKENTPSVHPFNHAYFFTGAVFRALKNLPKKDAKFTTFSYAKFYLFFLDFEQGHGNHNLKSFPDDIQQFISGWVNAIKRSGIKRRVFANRKPDFSGKPAEYTAQATSNSATSTFEGHSNGLPLFESLDHWSSAVIANSFDFGRPFQLRGDSMLWVPDGKTKQLTDIIKLLKTDPTQCVSSQNVSEVTTFWEKYEPIPADYALQPPEKIVNTPSEYIQLTEDGYTLMFDFFREFIISFWNKFNFQGSAWAMRATDVTPLDVLFAKAYAYLCKRQEDHFTRRVKTGPLYSVKSSEGFPYFLRHSDQSMLDLQLTRGGEGMPAFVCTACEDGNETYYGTTAMPLEFNGEIAPTKEQGNFTGRCVMTISERLRLMGISAETQKNPIWLTWIGTWQMAEKRLEVYKTDMTVRYDRNDPSYNFVEYYWRVLTLSIDIAVKRFAGFGDRTEHPKDQTKADIAKAIKQTNDANAWVFGIGNMETIVNTVIGAAKTALTTLAQFGAIVWKLVEIILNSPVMQVFIMDAIQQCQTAICEKRDSILKRPTPKKFNGDASSLLTVANAKALLSPSEFVKLSVAERQKCLGVDTANRATDKKDIFDFLFEAAGANGLVGLTWEKRMAYCHALVNKQVDLFAGVLINIPLGIGAAFKTLGGVDIIKTAITTMIQTSGASVYKRLVEHANTCNKIYLLYHQLTSGSCAEALSVVKTASSTISAHAPRLGWAFDKMMANAPYYALMALQTEDAFDMSTYETRIDALLNSTFVRNSGMKSGLQEDHEVDQLRHKRWMLPRATLEFEHVETKQVFKIPYGVNAIWEEVSDMADAALWDGTRATLSGFVRSDEMDAHVVAMANWYKVGGGECTLTLLTTYNQTRQKTKLSTITQRNSTNRVHALTHVLAGDKSRGARFKESLKSFYVMFMNLKEAKKRELERNGAISDELDAMQTEATANITSLRPPSMLDAKFFSIEITFAELNDMLLSMNGCHFYVSPEYETYVDASIALAYFKFKPTPR
jgi:hypothetical protein